MKKALLYLMTAVMILIPLQNVALAEYGQPEAPVLQAEEPAYKPGDAPAQTGISDCASPLLHAVLLAMLNQDASVFDAGEPALAWESLYNLLSLYGQLDDRSQYEGDFLALPAETVRDYAASLIPDLSALGALPEALTDRLTFRPEDGSYLVVCGIDGLSQLELSDPVWKDGLICLTGSLTFPEDGTVLARFQAGLEPSDNMLGFTLESMELL